MDIKEFMTLLPARERRSLKRGFTEEEKSAIEEIRKKDNPKTHCRDLIILPQMISRKVRVYSGREFIQIMIEPDMIGHRLGEFVQTRRSVAHSAPGIGATRSSASLSVK